MKEFAAFWTNYVNFTDRTTRRGFWMAFLFVVISTFIVSIISTFLGTANFLPALFVFQGFTYNILDILWQLAVLVPNIAIFVRRLRDAGKHWAYVLFGLIPFVFIWPDFIYLPPTVQGLFLILLPAAGIWIIVLLCKRSIPENDTPVV